MDKQQLFYQLNDNSQHQCDRILGTRAHEYKKLVAEIKPIQGLKEKLRAQKIRNGI
ncbi:hypothetical protein PPEP_a3685 [Pseudoalteromonas peptidolytica F12-50-A1]|uniref:Uncharacterized protein n=1 Tax=Pseudoalteromonas peptidolytica F12-50-A1 TaxID=1315280 RepID=A0A8I0T4L2_9GAMM|nr:hypothetical protein [Pseudoalteromonas peptidolytica F12-50-A1]GEK10450.1 hypothetical protein PPE03_26990 [Pseudoalteromonas peptidolytica]